MRSLVLALAGASCALVAGGCGGGSSEQAAGPSATPLPAEAKAPSVTSGRPQAPALAGRSLDGEPIALEDYRGRPVLVNVWSSW